MRSTASHPCLPSSWPRARSSRWLRSMSPRPRFDPRSTRSTRPDGAPCQTVCEVLESFSIPIYGIPGFEADDVIGTLARIAEERGHSVTIVSGDLDCLQLGPESGE